MHQKEVKMYRHGDILIAPVKEIPAGAKLRPTAILARGEATGHSHRIADLRTAEIFEAQGQTYLRILSERALLVHDEHAPIDLPRGLYRFWQQREYSPEAIRPVVD
jgi:hypothetical protein